MFSNSTITRPLRTSATGPVAATPLEASENLYRAIAENDGLNPYEQAIKSTPRHRASFVPKFQVPSGPREATTPVAPPPVPPFPESVSTAPPEGAGLAAPAWGQNSLGWRGSLPQAAATTRPIKADIAVTHCDRIIYGQRNIKYRLAMSFAANAIVPQRFIYFLQGPPGVGKTTLASALGEIYGRPVIIIRCDRVSSVESLFGYGLNWKSPGPGQITRSIIESGCTNPVIFFDEIDKISGDKKDAVLGALNEFLSPEKTHYRDEFLDCNVDISCASFLCAGNSTDIFERIPWLRSRMGQILPFSGYDKSNLCQIFSNYLLRNINDRQRAVATSARDAQPFVFTEQARDFIIDEYIMAMGGECGVRQLVSWLDDIYMGFLTIGAPGKAVEKSWLLENWDILLPGHPRKESMG